ASLLLCSLVSGAPTTSFSTLPYTTLFRSLSASGPRRCPDPGGYRGGSAGSCGAPPGAWRGRRCRGSPLARRTAAGPARCPPPRGADQVRGIVERPADRAGAARVRGVGSSAERRLGAGERHAGRLGAE